MGVSSFFGGMFSLFKAAFIAPLTSTYNFAQNTLGSGDASAGRPMGEWLANPVAA